MSEEIWKDVVGFEGRYRVSNLGRLMSIKYKEKKIKILNPDKSLGYPRANFYINGKSKKFLVHRLVAEAFGMNIVGREINHIDGIKENSNLSNLELSTRSENIKHAFKLGLCRPLRGSQNPSAKLNEKIVLDIHRLANSGTPRKAVCEMLGIPLHAYKSIRGGKAWKHVPRE